MRDNITGDLVKRRSSGFITACSLDIRSLQPVTSESLSEVLDLYVRVGACGPRNEDGWRHVTYYTLSESDLPKVAIYMNGTVIDYDVSTYDGKAVSVLSCHSPSHRRALLACGQVARRTDDAREKACDALEILPPTSPLVGHKFVVDSYDRADDKLCVEVSACQHGVTVSTPDGKRLCHAGYSTDGLEVVVPFGDQHVVIDRDSANRFYLRVECQPALP